MKNGILSENVKKMFEKCIVDHQRANTSYYNGYNYCNRNYNNSKNKKQDDATHILSLIY